MAPHYHVLVVPVGSYIHCNRIIITVLESAILIIYKKADHDTLSNKKKIVRGKRWGRRLVNNLDPFSGKHTRT